jgi:hypothetical protein
LVRRSTTRLAPHRSDGRVSRPAYSPARARGPTAAGAAGAGAG